MFTEWPLTLTNTSVVIIKDADVKWMKKEYESTRYYTGNGIKLSLSPVFSSLLFCFHNLISSSHLQRKWIKCLVTRSRKTVRRHLLSSYKICQNRPKTFSLNVWQADKRAQFILIAPILSCCPIYLYLSIYIFYTKIYESFYRFEFIKSISNNSVWQNHSWQIIFYHE